MATHTVTLTITRPTNADLLILLGNFIKANPIPKNPDGTPQFSDQDWFKERIERYAIEQIRFGAMIRRNEETPPDPVDDADFT